MFTGIVEETGIVERIAGGARSSRLTLRAATVLKGVALGDSIAVNGVCLTVTSFTDTRFTVDVMPETLAKTNLGELKPGERVNLERAMALGDRLGGHLVSGHVDGTGRIIRRETHDNAILLAIEADESLLRYMIPRGSVTVDGISLTVIAVGERDFSLSIIPHTLAHTNLQAKRPGDRVNLECDLIGKYVERFLLNQQGVFRQKAGASAVSAEFLREHGFM